MPKLPKLVRIEWEDAFAGPAGWTTADEYDPKPIHPVTVGWLIPDKLKGYITTADTYYEYDGELVYYGISHISERMVRKITVISGNKK